MSRNPLQSPMPQAKERDRRGAAVVEFAVVLPVFVLLVLGTIETCSMIFLQQSLEIAAYEATRVAIVPETKGSDVEFAANKLLSDRRVRNASISIVPADFQNAPYGSFIRVEVSAPCNDNSVFPLGFYSSRSLIGKVEMMKEFE